MSTHRKWIWHGGMLSILLGGISAACGPAVYYFVTYFGGRGSFPLAWRSFLSLSLLLWGAVISLLSFLLLHHLFHLSQHGLARGFAILVAACVFLAHYPIVFQMPPSGHIWTDGFIAGITSRGNLHELQTWGIDRLTEYWNGTLKTLDSSSSSSLSIKKLDPAIIPEYVQKIGGNPPSEGINLAMIPSSIVNQERVLDSSGKIVGGYCIAISWDDFGILIGTPLDFQSSSDLQQQWTHPWHFRKVQPGLFVYYIEK